MMRLALLPVFSVALPINPEILHAMSNDTVLEAPHLPYQLIQNAQPGEQWMDHGGYCGSWSIQRAAMTKGAWISQQQVRDHTSAAGGNDEEILAGNIDEALRNLKLDGEGFDWKNTPVPQQNAYFKWLKKQLVAGHPVAWFIMWNGQQYPIYNLQLPDGVYGHIEPVIGIMSNHPLTDETVYEDDTVVHFNDAGSQTYYRTFKQCRGTFSGRAGDSGRCPSGERQCINDKNSYGWAVKGFLDSTKALPVSLKIDPRDEPDTRTGSSPTPIRGTLTIEGLTSGSAYDIYRWNSVQEAFDYSNGYKIARFTADSDTHVFNDPKTFSSDSATYYRCVKSTGPAPPAPAPTPSPSPSPSPDCKDAWPFCGSDSCSGFMKKFCRKTCGDCDTFVI